MTVSDARFPEDIAYGSSGGPVFSTIITTNAAGYEKRNQQWQHPRAVYNVAHGVKSQAQLETLIAFFRAHHGRAEAFRFKDWSDYRVIGQPLGDGDGSRVRFALIKHYDSGQSRYTRRITHPVASTIMLYVDGAPYSNVSFDTETAEMVCDTAPASGTVITADVEFDVPVRFETDQLVARLDDYGVYSWDDIRLVEVRV